MPASSFAIVIARSAQDAPGFHARLIEQLADVMHWLAVAVFLLVVGALAGALWHRRSPVPDPADPGPERRLTRIVMLATGSTAVIVILLALASFTTGRRLTTPPAPGALHLRVTAHQWWWEVEYRDARAAGWITTANEIRVPVGRPVVMELRSADVIHAFWIPALGVKRDLIPGEVNSAWVRADRPGVYRGQCAEFCGHQHAKMGLLVVAEPADDFAAWLAQERTIPGVPSDSLARRGREVFLTSSCARCHTVRGTPAGGRLGPDLTHLASRRTLAAGTLPNTRGYLAGWVVDPQRIKPGAHMFPTRLAPDRLHALLAYLESLR